MSQLPPFRTRRSEPVLSLDDQEPDAPSLHDDDDDVPVLTQVVESEPPPPTSSPEATAPAPSERLQPDDIDALAAAVVADLQPELERLVRRALRRQLGLPNEEAPGGE